MKKLILALLLSHSAVVLAQKDYTFVYNSDSIVQAGVKLHDQEKYDEAIRHYDMIAHTDPGYLVAQYEKAMSLSAAGKKDELRKLFTGLHEKGKLKEHPELYMLYGSFLSDEKEFEASEKIFNEGLSYQPNSSVYLYNMAILYLRMEQNQKSLDLLKKVITINPNYSSAHYFIGLVAYDNGKIVEGTLAMMSYLAIAPNGRYAREAVLKLNEKYAQNYLGKNQLTFSETGDNFEEMEVILRNGLPLKNSYKLRSDIDDVAIRQVQAVTDYALEHQMGNGFFETTYMPWVADMARKKQFEGFSYYMLLSLEESLGKKLTAQKKKINAFYDGYIAKDFWNVYGRRKLEHFGSVQDVLVSIDGGKPFLVGPADANGVQKDGKYKRLNDMGNVAGELNFKNDQPEGLQKYFAREGKLLQERQYVGGKLDGTDMIYFADGSLKITQEYKAGQADGPASSFYPNGGKLCASNHKNDERNGMQTCYYPNGNKKSELNYSGGKPNGTYTFYNESGDITHKYDYTNGELNGDYLEYYDGKILKTEAKYSQGKPLGSVKTYYPTGALSDETIYVNGKATKYVSYFQNGKTDYVITYDQNEQVDSYVYYDWQGRKFYEEKYKGGELKGGTQYTKDKPAGFAVSIAKKPYIITDYDGNTITKGYFERGKKTGDWEYYYACGTLKSKETFVNNNELGMRYDYNKNGTPKFITNQIGNSFNGLYESFTNGKLIYTAYNTNGRQNGPYKVFYPGGELSHEGFMNDGEVDHIQYVYWRTGKLMGRNFFSDGQMTKSEFYDENGKNETTVEYKKMNGQQSYLIYGGFTTVSGEWANGERNGKYKRTEKDGTTMIDAKFVNGKETGTYKYFSPTGTLLSERNYYNGQLHGQRKQYDLNGALRLTDEYIFGDEYGKTERFYINKAKMYEYASLGGSQEGDMKYYNMAGEHILTLVFEQGKLKQYVKMDASGQVADKVDVRNETADIVSNYPGGKLAISLKYVKGLLEGDYIINGKDGKPHCTTKYSKGGVHGERNEYYASGKLYKREHLANGDYDGKQEYFTEDGKPILVANYKEDEFHGDFLLYKNGVLSLTKKYNTDELVSISK